MATRFYSSDTALMLSRMTSAFYRMHAESFDATRRRPWDGWKQLARVMRENGLGASADDGCASAVDGRASADDGAGLARQLRVLDLGCGNMRFEKFLLEEFREDGTGDGSGNGTTGADRNGDGCSCDGSGALDSGNLYSGEDAPFGSGPSKRFVFDCLDDCAELVGAGELGTGTGAGPEAFDLRFTRIDVVGTLLDRAKLPVERGAHDLSVAFGFMHHLPGEVLRLQAIDELVAATRPGGLVAMAFWRFADTDKGRAKAERETSEAFAGMDAGCGSPTPRTIEDVSPTPCTAGVATLPPDLELAPGDYLLGWQGQALPARFCHSFTDGDLDRIVEHVSPIAFPIARFRADGGSNEYLILEVGR